MSSTCVLFQSRNRRGLGHLMRGLNLAREVLALEPGARVVMHTRNSSAPAFCPPAVECVVESNDPATGWRQTLRRIAPDVVVYDTMLPDDAHTEPLPGDTRVVYVMRKCRPEVQTGILADPFLRRADALIVPHTQQEFGHPLPPDLRGRTEFVGLVARRPDPSTHAALRARYGVSAGDFLLVSSGGGGGFDHSAGPFFRAVEAIQRRLAGRDGLRHVAVLGPHFAGEPPVLPGAVVVAQEPALVDLFAMADLVVAEAGYNSVAEIRLVRVPAVLLPGQRRLDDQAERALDLARRGVARVLTYDVGSDSDSDSDTVADTVANTVAGLVDDPAALARMRAGYRAEEMVTGNHRAAMLVLGTAA